MTNPKTAAEWSWNLRHANPNYGSKTLDAIEAHNERILKLAMSEARVEGAQQFKEAAEKAVHACKTHGDWHAIEAIRALDPVSVTNQEK